MSDETHKKEANTSSTDNQSAFITDISVSRSFMMKRNTAFKKKEALKLLCISPKDIIANVNESYDFMKLNPSLGSHVINSSKNNKMIATITRFNEYKERSKRMAFNPSVLEKPNKTTSSTGGDHMVKDGKIKEMSILFSKSAIPNQNAMLSNVIKEMKFFFPAKFEEFSEYFKYNSFIISSENKQVLLFNVILDLVISTLKGAANEVYLQIIQALFEDFRLHIAHNSLHRAEFLEKIWAFQTEFVDEKISRVKADLNEMSIRYECVNDEAIKANERLKGIEKELASKQSELMFLSRENSKMKAAEIEKEKKLEEASNYIKELSSELKSKTNAYNDLILRFNLRVHPSKFPFASVEKESSNSVCNDSQSNHQSSVNLHHVVKGGDDSLTFKRLNSKFANNLKSKIQETSHLISETRKKQAEVNVFTSTFNVKEQLEENKDDNGPSTNKLELYVNKGVNVNDDKVKTVSTQTEISGMNEDIDSTHVIKAVKEKISDANIVAGVQKIFSEYDLVFKENNLLKTRIENIEENNEQIIETYTSIFQTFLERMKSSNAQIKHFVTDNIGKIKGQLWIGDFLQSIERLNQETVADNSISSIYDFIPKPELRQIQQDIQEIDPQSPMQNSNLAAVHTTTFESICKEFFEQFASLKLNLTLKKTIKILDAIYFEMIESVYFKHERLHFDTEERFIEFGEVVFLFFLKKFGLEKLARKKCLDFLKALTEYEAQSKRIAFFIKLLQIKRESVKKGRERRASLGGKSNFFKYLSTFILRQVLILIQFFKVNNFFIKQFNEEANTYQLVLLYPKLYDSLIACFEKMNLSQEMKGQLLAFIEKNKYSIAKSLNHVVDFDDLMEKTSEVLIQYELAHNSTLKSLFNAVDIEATGEIDLLDCLVLHEYVFSHKTTFKSIERLFNSLMNAKHRLTFDYFETFVIESDCFDIKLYREFIDTKGLAVKVILKKLKAELKGNQVVIFDHFMTRLNAVSIKNSAVFVEKIKAIKKKILALHKDEFGVEHFISIKLMDKVSLFLFNESKVNVIFSKLEFMYTLVEDSKQTAENYLWTYMKKSNWIKM